MVRAVLDCNVYVSALIRAEGPPGRILFHLLEKQAFDLVASPAIMEELKRCLKYRKVRKYVRLSDVELDLWFGSIELIALMVDGKGPVDSRLTDQDDQIYLDAAYNGKAVYVVSGDSHLIQLKRYEGVEIVTPAQFLKKIIR